MHNIHVFMKSMNSFQYGIAASRLYNDCLCAPVYTQTRSHVCLYACVKACLSWRPRSRVLNFSVDGGLGTNLFLCLAYLISQFVGFFNDVNDVHIESKATLTKILYAHGTW